MNRKNFATVIFLLIAAINVKAHFQLLLPDSDISDVPGKKYKIRAIFTHPMENGPVMNMGKPVKFGVMTEGKKRDLLKKLKNFKYRGKNAYSAEYTFTEPGDYIFYIEPAAYWEPMEKKMIIHYTKVVVDVGGALDGWDDMVGLPVEIRPLTCPVTMYTGNVFRGIVMKNGRPVPFAEVEVEYYNKDEKYRAATDVHTTQIIKADAFGTFSYVVIKPGWWGFAALITGDKKMKSPTGELVDVEQGGLIWIHAYEMQVKP